MRSNTAPRPISPCVSRSARRWWRSPMKGRVSRPSRWSWSSAPITGWKARAAGRRAASGSASASRARSSAPRAARSLWRTGPRAASARESPCLSRSRRACLSLRHVCRGGRGRLHRLDGLQSREIDHQAWRNPDPPCAAGRDRRAPPRPSRAPASAPRVATLGDAVDGAVMGSQPFEDISSLRLAARRPSIARDIAFCPGEAGG